jgi:AraC-like DNA-binding protein
VITRLADASRLGYKSEAAFAGAFKRVLGIPPGAVKRGRDPAAPEAVAAS